MNNARLRASDYPVQAHAEQSASQPPALVSGGANQAVRDFFRRGDRGQYEGGPADQVFDSLPSWDLPERAPIVRTPKQQARRVAMMWAEAGLMLGCVAFLVTAALKSPNDPSPQSATSNAEQPMQRAAAHTIAPGTGLAEPMKPSARVIRQPPANALAPMQSAEGVSSPPTVDLSRTHSVASSMVAPERRTVSVAPANPKPEAQRAKSRLVPAMPAARRTDATTATNTVPTKRAVAAFPDD